MLLMHKQVNGILMCCFAGMVKFGGVEGGKVFAPKMERRFLMEERVVVFGEM